MLSLIHLELIFVFGMNERSGFRDLPGGQVAKTLCSVQGPGFNPCSGTWILHAATSFMALNRRSKILPQLRPASQPNKYWFVFKESSFIGALALTPSPEQFLLSSPGCGSYCPCVALLFHYPHKINSHVSTAPLSTGRWSLHQQPHGLCYDGYTSSNLLMGTSSLYPSF